MASEIVLCDARPRYVVRLHQWRGASSQSQVEMMKRQRKMNRVVKRAHHAISIALARDAKLERLADHHKDGDL